MQIRMAYDERSALLVHGLGKLLGAFEDSPDIASFARPKRGELCGQRVVEAAQFYLAVQCLHNRAVSRRVRFAWRAASKLRWKDRRMDFPHHFAKRDPLCP